VWPYGLIFFAKLNCSDAAICLATHILQCTSELRTDIKDCVMFECCAAPGEAFNILWCVLQIAHAALLMNVSMSAGSSELAVSISEVCIII
jgi:hypothetical protein